MKAILLARVSTEEQKDAGNSLPAQVDRMERYCERKNLEVVETFSFDESAYKTKRDEFDRILEYLNKDKNKIAVCFDKVDRLSRNVFDQRVSTLYEKAVADEIELHFVSDGQVINSNMSAVEKFQFGMSLGLAKYYSDAISDNVKRAFENKRKKGEWTGRVKIGYQNITDEKGNKDIILDDEYSGLVRKAFELYASGNYSLRSLLAEVTKLGLKTRSGNPLHLSTLEAILNETFYHGLAYSKKYNQYYQHKYQTIITKELFDACQNIKNKRNKNPSKSKGKDYIFRGLIKCSDCGCTVTPEIKTKKSGKQYIYYSCTNAKKICKRDYVSEKALLEPILKIFDQLENIPSKTLNMITEELRNSTEAEIKFHKKQLARIQSEYNSIQAKISRLMDLFLDGSITKEDHATKLHEFKEKQSKLNTEIEIYTKADKDYLLTVNTVFSLAKRAKSIFESSEVSEKRVFINYLIQNPKLKNKKLSFSVTSPFNEMLDFGRCPRKLPQLDSNQ